VVQNVEEAGRESDVAFIREIEWFSDNHETQYLGPNLITGREAYREGAADRGNSRGGRRRMSEL